uniref:C2H2-type domain-containing protein n=1 Tax=Hucho hucho TaxID=62062 RepID=A0A4W5KLY8_9TELE
MCHGGTRMMSVDTMLARQHGSQEAFGVMEKTTQGRNYQCVTCLKCFSAPSKLQRHILSHTGQRPFRCHVCEKAFRQLAHLKLHLNTHLYPKRTEQKKMNVKSSLHPSVYENTPPVKIDNSKACLQTCSLDPVGAEDTLEVDIRPTAPVHIIEENSLCSSRCIAELYPPHSEVERFEKQHTEEEPIRNHDDWSEPEKQTLDEDRSSRDETVDKHTQIIENSNSHKCPECFKCFSAPSKLKRHCLIHTGQKPFQCYLCRRAFRQLAHLKVHYRIHSGVAKSRSLKSFSQPQRSKTWPRNYPCNICGRRFKQKRNLIVHQRTHQVPDTAVHPDKLDNTSKACLPTHTDHASQVDFSNSENAIAYNTELNEKSQIHVVEGLDSLSEEWHNSAKHASQDIDLTRSSDRNNKSSVSNRTDRTNTGKVRENQCMLCLKKFDYPSKLSRHLLVHMDIKPFRCTVCSKSFRQLCHLQNHMKAHHVKRDNVLKSVEDDPDQPGVILLKDKSVSEMRRNQSEHLDQVSQPQEASRDISEVGCFLSQYVLPVRPTFSHCSTDNLYNYGAQQPTWNPSGKLLPGLDCDTVNRKSAAEPVSLRQGHNTDYTNTSDVFESTPTHQSLVGISKQRSCIFQNKPTIHARGRYCCPICSKRFDAPSKLQRHSLIHTGQRSYQCPTCLKTFRQKAHLKGHQSVHEQRKEAKPSTNHSDDRETKSFSRPKRTPSSNEKDVVFCNRSQKTSRDSDLSAVPPTQSDCPLTNNVNSPPPPSVAPRTSGGYQCMACLKKFDYPSKLSRHLLVHMGIKPFRCAVCSKSFRQLCHLQSHMKVHNSKTTLHEDGLQRNINLAQLDNIAPEAGVVSEGHIFAASLHPDEPGPSQTFGNNIQNSNGGESLSHYCSTESMNQSTEIIRKNETTPTPEQSEDMKSMKSENNCLVEQKCISPPQLTKSTWNIAEEKHVDKFPSDEYYGQQNHPLIPNWLNPYPYHQETANNKQTYSIATHRLPYLEEPGPSHSDQPEILVDVNHKLNQYQSPLESPSTNSQYEAKEEERLEVGLRSEFNVTYKSEPPNDLHACSDCSQCFTTKGKLNHHRCSPRHSVEERQASSYRCAICFKSFEAPSKLKRHYVIHTGQRPFQCTVCGKAFTQAGHLKTHLQIHR